MSATDELRRMLDERGVEHRDGDTRTGFTAGGIDWEAYEHIVFGEHTGLVSLMTAIAPEQAIEATLGRGMCRRVLYKPTKVLVCSECGAGIPKQLDKYCFLHYCPNCGRKVVGA